MTFSRLEEFSRVEMESSSNDETIEADRGKPIEKLSSARAVSAKYMVSDCPSDEELLHCHYNIFTSLLEQITQQRSEFQQGHGFLNKSDSDAVHLASRYSAQNGASTVIDEITEAVEVENCVVVGDGDSSDSSGDDQDSQLSSHVHGQLRLFLSQIAGLYRPENPFHNFEHASHVTFSAYQLIRRLATRELPQSPVKNELIDPWMELPDHDILPCAFASDPLAHFAIVFSALIHDVDHSGVPNATLIKEGAPLSKKYMDKSVAEQNSVDMAWDILESEDLHDLRACIFPTRRDYNRFRTMVVNIVMATDIADGALRAFQEQKWDKSFGGASENHYSSEDLNRKATVTMDLVMMASDISHTFQSFEVFCKWNRRLFFEMYKTFEEGRSPKNPLDFWHKGEFFFFDKHIIPLAQRLQQTGVFGKSADMLLQNARNNRLQWEKHGERLVEELKAEVQQKHESALIPVEQVNDSPVFCSLVQLFCRGSRPQYLQTNTEEDIEEGEMDDVSEANDELDSRDYRYIFCGPCSKGRMKKL